MGVCIGGSWDSISVSGITGTTGVVWVSASQAWSGTDILMDPANLLLPGIPLHTWWVGVSEYTGRVVVTVYSLVPLVWDEVILYRSDLVLIHYLVHPECPCLSYLRQSWWSY